MPEIGTIMAISSETLDGLINKTFSDTENTIAILERWFCRKNEKPDFFDHISELTDSVSAWDKGRIFDNTSEIRWERAVDGFHIVWIKDDGTIPPEWQTKEQIKLVGKRKILLWGKRIEDKELWYEKQVPRILKYPVSGEGERVYALLNEYTLMDRSTVYRFKEVIAE